MGELLTMKRIKGIAYSTAVLFLFIHIAMFGVFYHYGVRPMAWFNVFSMTFYVAMLAFIYKENMFVFVLATFLEINTHMGLAAYFVGWENGFQATLIGICTMLFFAEYVGRSIKIRSVQSMLLTPLAMATYLASFFASWLFPTPYHLPPIVTAVFQIAWCLIIFVVMTAILSLLVSVTVKAQEDLTEAVNRDQLTGLPNRYYMSDVMKRIAVEGCKGRRWVAIADIDNFKEINDSYGHNCGDYILSTVASLLNESSVIEICRWGGEEFLLVDERGELDPQTYLETLRAAVDKYEFNYQGLPIHMTVTIGMAWMEDGQTTDSWINAADRKLYQGKRAGRNRVMA